MPHVIAPALSSLVLLLPLASSLLPSLPGTGSLLSHLGLTPTAFPATILPLFVVAWVVLGMGYARWLHRRDPGRLVHLGQVSEEEE